MTRPSITLRSHRQQVLEIARAYGAKNIRALGSAARGADRVLAEARPL
jgi:predicted nucleotidyltransferase